MPTLSNLTIYPIKSCRGIDLAEATVTPAGLKTGIVRDRQWMVVDLNGEFLTQRELPKMALIRPELDTGGLKLSFPGKGPFRLAPAVAGALASNAQVRIWNDSVLALDAGDEAAAWFSEALGAECRLVEFDPEGKRLADTKWTDGLEVPTLFSDGFPMLLIGNQSLDDLNGRLQRSGRAALSMNRFRPNLVIDGVDAFEEDYLASLQIGKALLKPVKPCPRCPIPSIEQETGSIGPDPLDVLKTYRANSRLNGAITFGTNVILLEGEGTTLRLGQEITVELSF